MSADHFRTIAETVEFRQKIERSEFLAIAFAITTDDEFFDRLAAIEKRYFDATHHCWAFRLFAGGDVRQRSADAGEPSGTAGKPILSAIEGAGVHDAAVVVVRWYGGVKLGSGGLSRAYRETAAGALALAKPLDRYLYQRFTITVPFAMLSVAYRLSAPPDVILAGEEYGENNLFFVDVRASAADHFARTLDERRLAFTRDLTPRLR
jgi:uncharacterized YigZ family protein